MEEQQLLDLIIRQQDWEQLIYNIVTVENIDPMNVDLVKLATSFMEYLKKVESLDFRIPARVVLVAAILLKMKMDYLFSTPTEGMGEEEMELNEEELSKIDFDSLKEYIEKFNLPVVRRPVRKVTLEELIDALKKAIAVEERRKERKIRVKKKLEKEVEITQESIDEKLNKLLAEIDLLIKKFKTKTIPFSKIVERWDRDNIIDRFIPVVYLDFQRKIDAKQEEFFKEIYLTKLENGHSKLQKRKRS
ncbi:MAG: segregation/condensation protein A [Candidatus Aenigmarchaeota archaeon]|nr:segregation/condensation protein A [Candidatus Aenigmarchaeota archaeon]